MRRDDSGQPAPLGSWRLFLEPLIGQGKPVSVARLDEALRELTGRHGDARGELYAYLNARQAVRANRAFWIGEALRECGIEWANGPLALVAADQLAEFVALLALLSTQGDGPEGRATILAAACAVLTCDDPDDQELVDVQRDTRERLAHFGRASSDLVQSAWNALAKKRGSYGRLFQLVRPGLRDAVISASLTNAESRSRRVFEDLGRWAISFAQRSTRLLGIVEVRFVCRARVDQRRTQSYQYREALLNVLRESPMDFEEILSDATFPFLPRDNIRANRTNKKAKNKK